jgi:hypothetical protein
MSVKEAVKTANDFVESLRSTIGYTDVRLEEVDRSDDGKWLITLGCARGILDKREFKTVKVNDIGQVESMIIRNP